MTYLQLKYLRRIPGMQSFTRQIFVNLHVLVIISTLFEDAASLCGFLKDIDNPREKRLLTASKQAHLFCSSRTRMESS